MTVASAFAFISALIKAVPALRAWWEELVSLYVQRQIAVMKREHRDGIKRAVYEQDQRGLEEAIGSPRAGEASGIPGTVILDDLPGVVHSKGRD